MPEEKIVKCKGCGADIIFVKLQSRKITPIDVKIEQMVSTIEDEFGNIHGYEVIGVRKSHFATCPQANNFRKKDERIQGNHNGNSIHRND